MRTLGPIEVGDHWMVAAAAMLMVGFPLSIIARVP